MEYLIYFSNKKWIEVSAKFVTPLDHSSSQVASGSRKNQFSIFTDKGVTEEAAKVCTFLGIEPRDLMQK